MGNRRTFLRTTSLAAIGSMMLDHTELFALENQPVAFDLHCHPSMFFASGTTLYKGDEHFTKSIEQMKSAGLCGAFFSLVGDAPLIEITPAGIKPKGRYQKDLGLNEYARQIAIIKQLLLKNNVTVAKHVDDFSAHNLAAFLSIEGGDLFEGNMQLLHTMYEDGVRSIQIVHYVPNTLGDLQTESAQHNGLSLAGKQLVKSMNALKMLIDVAHASYDTVKDVVALTDSPIILSHSILKMEDNRPIAKRAISIDHAKAVASVGGVIGAWPSGFNKSFDEYVDNVKRLVDVVGIEHVGIGTDMDANFKPVIDTYEQLPALQERLLEKGFSKSESEKIMGLNAQRVIKKVLG